MRIRYKDAITCFYVVLVYNDDDIGVAHANDIWLPCAPGCECMVGVDDE